MEAPESRKSSVPIWIEKTFPGGREHGSVVDGVLVILSFSKADTSAQGVLVRIWHSQLRFKGYRVTKQGLALNITY